MNFVQAYESVLINILIGLIILTAYGLKIITGLGFMRLKKEKNVFPTKTRVMGYQKRS